MINFLKRYLKRSLYFFSSEGWKIIFLLLFFLYIFGFFSMRAFEGIESDLVNNYTWWFLVTVTTVGYGDISPVTEYGKIVAEIIMILGIGSLAMFIGKIAEAIMYLNFKKQKGMINLREKDHILIMGYKGNETDNLIEEIFADLEKIDKTIVLASNNLENNPFSFDKVKFVKGELASKEVLERSCVKDASKIIIQGCDDNETFFTAYAVREINTSGHMVVYLQNDEHIQKIKNLPSISKEKNQVILQYHTYMMAQEMLDPESSQVLGELMSNLNGSTLYRFELPHDLSKIWDEEKKFQDLFLQFKVKHNGTILAIKKDNDIITNPDMGIKVNDLSAVFYIAPFRIKIVNWKTLLS